MKKTLLMLASLTCATTVMADSAKVVLRENVQSHEYVSKVEIKTTKDTFQTGKWVVMELDTDLNMTCYEINAALLAINEIEGPHGFKVQAPEISRTKKSVECPNS